MMTESGLEESIGRNSYTPECPECKSEIVKRIKSEYSTHHLCLNNGCAMIVF